MNVGRRLRPLSGEVIDQLPEPCRRCLFWELGAERPDRGDPGEAAEAATRKQAWCVDRAMDGTPPGRVARVGDAPAGYVLFGPTDGFAPQLGGAPAASRDALLVATVWVEPGLRGRGLGRLLVQAAVREAGRLELAAVEAHGDHAFREGRCLLPVPWLLGEGFEVHRPHVRFPLLRLDLGKTVRWSESLEQALDELLEHVPGRAVPAPGAASVAATDRAPAS